MYRTTLATLMHHLDSLFDDFLQGHITMQVYLREHEALVARSGWSRSMLLDKIDRGWDRPAAHEMVWVENGVTGAPQWYN